MFDRCGLNVWSEGDDFGQDWHDPEEDNPRRLPRIGLFIIVLLLLAFVMFSAFILVSRSLVTRSPTRTAEVWTQAFVDGDDRRMLDLTCNDQLLVANLRSLVSTGDRILELIPAEMLMLELAGELPAVPDIGDIRRVLDDIRVDLSRLEFSAPDGATEQTTVMVTGQARVRVLGAWFGFPLNERWTMTEVDGNWRWCGREEGVPSSPD